MAKFEKNDVLIIVYAIGVFIYSLMNFMQVYNSGASGYSLSPLFYLYAIVSLLPAFTVKDPTWKVISIILVLVGKSLNIVLAATL
ncbi:MAG: hypothetical protein IJ557_06480 [Bacteroidaceae bacterium]|nr:hypothetical protein [Bacteroidaceae bacterium]